MKHEVSLQRFRYPETEPHPELLQSVPPTAHIKIILSASSYLSLDDLTGLFLSG